MNGFMENACREYHHQVLNLADAILFSDYLQEKNGTKLEMLREILIDHIDECTSCKPSIQPDRSKREDANFKSSMAIARAIKKRCGTQNTDDKSVREVQ
jgi:hypothetical protein